MSIKKSLNDLESRNGAARSSLPVLPGTGGREAAVARGWAGSNTASSTTNQFEEDDYAAREYWPTINKTSTDGLLTIQIKPIKAIKLKIGGHATFKQPV